MTFQVKNILRSTRIGVCLGLLLLLSLGLAPPAQGSNRGGAPDLAPVCNNGCTAIAGSPITIVIGKDASYQVYYTALGSRASQVYQPLFDEADAGLFVSYAGYVVGPDFWSHFTTAANAYDAWQSVSQSGVTGSGTPAAPWLVQTVVRHPSSGVRLTANTRYANGANSFRIEWEICLPAAGNASAFLAADYYMQGGDLDRSYGVYDSSSGAVGATNASMTWLQAFAPLSPADRYFAGAPGSLWAAIGQSGAPGPGFNNAVNTAPLDNAAGLQWNRALNPCGQISADWIITGLDAANSTTLFMPFLFR